MNDDVDPGPRRPLPAERSSRPANLLDVLRLIAAAMVVVGHSWSLLGMSGVPTLAGITVHHLGVTVFFTISGYLLSASWARSPRPAAFLVRRCLRIFPALILVVLVTVFALGPLLTTLPSGDYLGFEPHLAIPAQRDARRPV